MRTFPGLLIFVLVLLTACCDDDPQALSSEELLKAHDWILFSTVREPGQIPDEEPGPTYTVLKFDEATFSGSDYTGEFYDLGEWSMEDDILTMDGDVYQVIDLSSTKLVYIAPDEAVVTRLAIDK